MTIKEDIFEETVADLGANFKSTDSEVLSNLLTDVINDALSMANRSESEASITALKSNIKKAVKAIYLQRGVEDVRSNSVGGLSNTYEDVMDMMLRDIIRQNKRLLR